MFDIFSLLVLVVLIAAAGFVFLYRYVLRAEKQSQKNNLLVRHKPETFVLVFGATAWSEGPSPELEARLKTALALEELIQPDKYFLFGGIAEVNEAEAMRSYLLNKGIPHEKLIADCLGDNTRLSIERFAHSIGKLPQQQLIAVSSGYHASRIQSEGKKHQLNFFVISPHHSPEIANARVHQIRLISEVLAILWYSAPRGLTMKIKTSSSTFRHSIPNYFIKKVLK